MSHFLLMYWPTTMLEASSRAMGIMERPVMSGSIFHILRTERTPRKRASKNIRNPEP